MRGARRTAVLACACLLLAGCGETGQIDGGAGDPGPGQGTDDEDVMNPFAHDTSGEIIEVDDVEVELELFTFREGLRIAPIRLTNNGDRDLRVRDVRGGPPTIEEQDPDGTTTWTWLRAQVPDPDDEPEEMAGEWDVPNIRAVALLAGETVEIVPTRPHAVDAGPQRLRVCVEVEDTEGRTSRRLDSDTTGDRERMREWMDGQDILVACSDAVEFDLAELPEYG
jgi:hypothetical protein